MALEKAWKNLEAHYQDNSNLDIADLFTEDSQRSNQFCLNTCGLHLDFSKNRVTHSTLQLLLDLAKEKGLEKKIDALLSGETVNKSENRPALHTALRANAEDRPQEVTACLQAMEIFCDRLSSGKLLGYSNKKIKHLINIGIGGSYLGPKFVTEALKPFHSNEVEVHFIANIDEADLNQTLENLPLEQCVFVVASKSFGTQETLLNAYTIRARYLEIGVKESDLEKHFVAVTSNVDKAVEFGIKTCFPMWDWVGGRYSLWSAIGIPILAAIGKENFYALLNGANEMDEHFRSADLKENMPTIMGLLSIWYQNFCGARSHAILPYDYNLRKLPDHLQQLDMESLGKSCSIDGIPVNYQTGAVIWGGEGTNGQHAFHQLLHQGSHLIPCDFIVALRSFYPEKEHHQWLFANCLAQSRALMTGHSEKDIPEHQHIPGNQPSNTIVADTFDPKSLGALIALYEHRVFVQGVILDINPFDQWGVELGKKIGEQIFPALGENNDDSINNFDQSTESMIDKYKRGSII